MQLRVTKKPDLKERLKVILRGDYRAFLKSAGTIITRDIISNIRHQVEPDGRSRLKKNAKSTIDQKRREGVPNAERSSLIWRERLLISPSTYIVKTNKKQMKMFLAPVRKKIGKRLQGKLGYIFFKIGPDARIQIMKRWRDFIKRGLR